MFFFFEKGKLSWNLNLYIIFSQYFKSKTMQQFPSNCILFSVKLSVSNRAHQMNDSHHNTEKMFAHVTKQLRLLKPAV